MTDCVHTQLTLPIFFNFKSFSQLCSICSPFQMHDYQLFGDDTAMNGLKLLCTGEHMNTTITSGFGHRGEWTPRVTCHQEYGQLMYLRAFALQVEEHVGFLTLFIVTLIKLVLYRKE